MNRKQTIGRGARLMKVLKANTEANIQKPLETITEPVDEQIEELDKWNPMAEDFCSTKNTLVLNPDKDPECVVTGRMVGEDITLGKYKVCDFYLKYGSCADGDYCNRLHVDPKSRDKIGKLQKVYGANQDRMCLNYKYLSDQHLTSDELQEERAATLLISITASQTPSNFYFVIPYHENYNFASFNDEEISFYVQRIQQSSSYKTNLNKCHEQLAYLFNTNYRRDNIDDPIYRGQIVACKLDDGRFCRAEVIEEDIYNDYKYKLHLLDVGTEVELIREHIYDIKAGSLNAPPMAYFARLNIVPKNSMSWSKEAISYFQEAIMGNRRHMLCNVLSFVPEGRMYTVDLYDIESRTSLGESMIACGYAELDMKF